MREWNLMQSGHRPDGRRRAGSQRFQPERELFASIEPVSRRRLLEAGLEAFAIRGFHGTTTRDISARAEMSPAALYVHFPSKADLLFEIIRTGQEHLHERITGILRGPGSPAERLRNLMLMHVTFNASHLAMAYVANHERRGLERAEFVKIEAIRADSMAATYDTLREGVACGEFEIEDYEAAVIAIASIAVDIPIWAGTISRTPQELAASYASLVLKMVGDKSRKVPKPSNTPPMDWPISAG
jgi:AcrR family transcriptional regulator